MSAPPDFPRVVLWEHVEPLLERLSALEKKVGLVEANQTEYVDTKEAMRITGIKSPDTLKRLRERPNSPIIVRVGDETSKRPRYQRASLLAYCESKRITPLHSGRNLAA